VGTRKIVQLGDSALRKTARPQKTFDKRLWNLLDDLSETMYRAPGLGLSATQVGVLRRVAVVDVGEGLTELINPELVEARGEQCGREGCLSLEGRQGIVRRPEWVRVRAYDRKGKVFELEGEDLMARCLCHEMDHLDGRLFIDIMDSEVPEDEIEYMTEAEDEPTGGRR